MPEGEHGWREAVVIAAARSGGGWPANSSAELTPAAPGHGAYYQAFLAGGVLYRDPQGNPQVRRPPGATGPGRKSNIAFLPRKRSKSSPGWWTSASCASHPGSGLFLLMAADANRITHPLLLDRQRRRCFWLTPDALYDNSERGLNLAVTAQGLDALLLQGHALALLKNPVSSLARLGDLGVETRHAFHAAAPPKSPGIPRPPVCRRGYGPPPMGRLARPLHRNAARGRLAGPAHRWGPLLQPPPPGHRQRDQPREFRGLHLREGRRGHRRGGPNQGTLPANPGQGSPGQHGEHCGRDEPAGHADAAGLRPAGLHPQLPAARLPAPSPALPQPVVLGRPFQDAPD